MSCRSIMYRLFRPYFWIILFASLALIPLYFIQARSQPQVEAASPLRPLFSMPGGYYDKDILLEISAPHPEAKILFTLDGQTPTEANATLYSRPIRLGADAPAVTVVRARVVLPGTEPGPVAGESYFMGLQATLPLLSLIVDPDDLWGPEQGIYANPYEKGIEWERAVDVTFVDENRRSGFHIPAGLRIHGGWTRSFDKKSLRLYFRSEYGINRLEYPLFARGGLQSFKRLVLHNGAQDSPQPGRNWTIIRSPLVSRLASELEGYATRSRAVLLFLNGEPWGIYQIRERIDRWFLADRYGIESADLLDTPALPEHQVIAEGDREHWDHLLQFVQTHNLADPAHYTYVKTQVDIDSLIDYTILQIYSANIDWPHRNVNLFRPRVQGGRWHWIFWDSDYSFGLEPWSSVERNMMHQALLPENPETGGRDTLLLRRLLENPAFLNRFLSRAADLLNTTLAPEAVIAQIDALAAELEPDIAYENGRWSSSVKWQSSVQALRDFAQQRPAFVRQHIIQEFNLEGTASLAFRPPTGGSGRVAVNDALLPALPWEGIYFCGSSVQVTAVPEPGYRFAGWDAPDLPPSPIITLTASISRTLAPRFESIGEATLRPGDVIFTGYHADDEGRIEGDWIELQVTRRGGVDLRGWRVTDNDNKTATDEGSLIFPDHPAFASVPRGTFILIIATKTANNDARYPQDDLKVWDRRLVLYAGNGHLDIDSDPWFNLGARDNLALLAPGPTESWADDQGIAFLSTSPAVTPASFGVLVDGLTGAE